MPRITCNTPSSGKEIPVTVLNLGTSAVTVLNAPDFSISDTNGTNPGRDPADTTRGVKAGRLTLLGPLYLYNKNASSRTVTISRISQAGVTTTLAVQVVEAGQTEPVLLQGLGFYNYPNTGGVPGALPISGDVSIVNGDRLTLVASAGSSIDVAFIYEESSVNDHVGVSLYA
jgi:hypothetical protein